MKFSDLWLNESILKALAVQGYETPTAIQEQAIPIVLQGRDIVGSAQTGTGKTAAFSLPILHMLNKSIAEGVKQKDKKIRCLIITPTRELAIQIWENIEAYGKFLNIQHTVVFGGVKQYSQVKAIQRGLDILVATPGRLLDLIQQKIIHLNAVEILVLDEADRMLDMWFINDIKKILLHVPKKKQSLFFSATMPPEIQKLANSLLNDPVKIAVTPQSSTVDTVQQYVYFVDSTQKIQLLLYLLNDPKIAHALVFIQMKHRANKLVDVLTKHGITASAIHGNKSQSARQSALNKFKNREIRVLVATDVAARGIDIDDLSHVILYEMPVEPETYVHRIGRTGRAGQNGIAISFCDHSEKKTLETIEKLIGQKIPVAKDQPFHVDLATTRPQPAAPDAYRPRNHRGGRPHGKPAGEKTPYRGGRADDATKGYTPRHGKSTSTTHAKSPHSSKHTSSSSRPEGSPRSEGSTGTRHQKSPAKRDNDRRKSFGR